jgi:hypothetical protein
MTFNNKQGFIRSHLFLSFNIGCVFLYWFLCLYRCCLYLEYNVLRYTVLCVRIVILSDIYSMKT